MSIKWNELLTVGINDYLDEPQKHYGGQKKLDTSTPSLVCSVAKLCLALGDPMDCATPGSSVLHCLLMSAHSHTYWVANASSRLAKTKYTEPQAWLTSERSQGWLERNKVGTFRDNEGSLAVHIYQITELYQSVQFSHSVMSDSLQPHELQHAISNSWSSLKLMSTESVMPSNRLILCRPLLLPPSIFPSQFFASGGQTIGVQLQHQSFQ